MVSKTWVQSWGWSSPHSLLGECKQLWFSAKEVLVAWAQNWLPTPYPSKVGSDLTFLPGWWQQDPAAGSLDISFNGRQEMKIESQKICFLQDEEICKNKHNEKFRQYENNDWGWHIHTLDTMYKIANEWGATILQLRFSFKYENSEGSID